MPENPKLDDFIAEIKKEVNNNKNDNIKPRRKKSILDFFQQGPKPKPHNKTNARPAVKPHKRSSEASETLFPQSTLEKSQEQKTEIRLLSMEPLKTLESPRRPLGGVTAEVVSSSRTEKTVWYMGEKDDIAVQIQGYLMDVKYDSDSRKAVLYIYNPRDRRLYRWYDASGHKPYFLVGAEPGLELRNIILKGIKDQAEHIFSGFQTVRKFDTIKRREVRLTKVIVEDPLAVRTLREKVAGEGIPYYEADIRYHNNYVYDKQLIPGMIVTADTADVKLLAYVADEDSREKVLKAFSDEPDEVRKRAVEWIPLFELDPPDPPKIAVDIEVYTPYAGELPDPEKALYPVISIAMVDDSRRRIVLVLNREDVEPNIPEDIEDGTEIIIFEDEYSMLLEAMRIIEQYPIIVTFNGDNFDIPYLYNRMVMLGLSPSTIPIEFHRDSASFRNSLHIDLYKFFDIRALQVYAFGNKYREKNLDSVAEALLGRKKVALDKPVSELDLATLIKYNLTDSELTMELLTYANKLVWNLIVLLMRISKLGLEDVTRSQVSAWIKSLLHWEHRRRGYLIPRREDILAIGGQAKSSAIIKDKKYKGAIVLSPPQGVFFNILVLDFASLYPSVIKNWNLSYETVNNPNCKGEKRRVPEVDHEVCMDMRGLTSEIVGLLRDFRVKIYKKRAKDKSLSDIARLWYNTVQSAMKVYINASYGVFGNETFAYYSPAVAESVTAIGRAVLKDTLKKAEELGLMILYGDTDSIFIWNPPEESLENIIGYVKEKHSLDLEVDKEFRLVLFSGLKKNYIGITPDGNAVIKGMVGKKSNTPEFLKREFAKATEILASINSPEDLLVAIDKMRNHIETILNKLKRREYMLDELAIRVMLSKDPKAYTKNTPQHVKAALLLRKYGLRVTKGTVVTYVKTKDSLGVRPVKLARLSEVDVNKYVEFVRTAFEQMLTALGLDWSRLKGQRKLLFFGSS